MNNKEAVEKILSIRVDYNNAIKGIADYQKKIEGLKEREKELKMELNAGKVSRSEYHRELAAIREATKEYQTEVRNLSKEIQDNIKFEKSQVDSVDALRAALARQKAEYYALSKAERESAQGVALQKLIKETNDDIKQAEEAIGVFSRNVGNYEEAIKNAFGLNNSFASSLLNMTKSGSGLSGMFDSAKTSAAAFLKTLAGFLANPVFLALAGIAGAGTVFKWWFDYNQGLAEATRLTKEFLGLSGNSLKAVRNEIQATADVYGKDYKEVLETTDALMSQYGLTAEQAMTVIQDGFQAGADEGGNMLSKIKDLAPQFHDAGIAADEMMAIMAQTRSGIFSEGGMDLIAMASKKIREMATGTESALNGIGISAKQVEEDLSSGAKSTFDVIQEVSAKLRELPQDSQEVGNVLKDVFGRQGASAGLQLIEQLDTMTKDIEEVKKVTGEYGEATRKQMETQKELNNVVSAMFDVTDKGFEAITVQAKTYITEGLISLLKWVVELTNKFIDLYNRSWAVRAPIQGIITVVKAGWGIISNVFKAVFSVLKELINTLMGLGKVIQGVLNADWSLIKEGAIEAGKGVAQAVADVAKGIGGAISDTVMSAIDGIKNTVKSADVPPIVIPVTVDNPDIPDVNKPSGGTKPTPVKSDADEKKDSDAAKKAAKEREREEKEEARHQAQMAKILADGEKQMLAIITSNLARQRAAINVEYDNQIAALKTKLATEAKLTEDAKKSLNEQIINLERDKQRKLQEFDDGRVRALAEARSQELSKEIELTKKGSEERLALVQEQLTVEYDNRRSILDEKIQEQQNHVLELSKEMSRAVEEGRSEEEISAIEARMETEQGILDSYSQQREQADEEQRMKMAEAQDEFDNEQIEKMKLVYQNQIDELMLKDDRTYEEQREMLDLQREQAQEYLDMLMERGEQENQTTEEYNEELIEAKQQLAEKEKAVQEYEAEVENARLSAASQVTGGLIKLMDAIGKNNEAMAKLSKVVTLAQIAIDTGKALSSGIASAAKMPYPSNLLAIAQTVATVLANVATAVSTVNSAKFAHGGIVEDDDPKNNDDKVLIRVNKGEMVLNEDEQKRLHQDLTGKSGNFTKADQKELFGLAAGTVQQPLDFTPVTSSFSEIGGGAPVNSRQISDGIAAESGMVEQMADTIENMPAPVVSVEDINDGQRRVEVIENIDSI